MTVRLAMVRSDGVEQLVVAVDGGVVAVGAVNEELGTTLPVDLDSLVQQGRIEELGDALERSRIEPAPVDGLVFGPAVRRPPKLWGVGLNYRTHAGDLDTPQPTAAPGSYLRPNTTIIGDGDLIELPRASDRVTGEAELGLIIGRTGRDISSDAFDEYVFGFTTILDMTAEDLIRVNPRYVPRAKSFDTFCSIGPWVVTIDEIDDLPSVLVETVVDGEVRSSATVSEMTFSPPWIVETFSSGTTFQAGDVICTGTPGAAVLSDGATTEARVTGVGTLRNRVRSAPR